MPRFIPCLLLVSSVLLPIARGPALADQNDPRLGRLFRNLAAAESPPEARVVEDQIWSVWLECEPEDLRRTLERGVAAMGQGDYAAALRAFDTVVEREPRFAEGWNKRATVHFLLGSFEASIRDIERTLALEPRHFGALSGLAMIREAQRRPFEALEALERVVVLHPQMPQLQERVDRLTRQLGEPI